jgi:hypothetical protein
MAELAVLAVAINVVQVIKDASNECLERIRAARNLGALGECCAETTSQVHSGPSSIQSHDGIVPHTCTMLLLITCRRDARLLSELTHNLRAWNVSQIGCAVLNTRVDDTNRLAFHSL